MSKAKFPSRRKDGSVSVAARFSVSDPAQKKLVEDYVSDWIARKTLVDGAELLNELLVEPRVVGRTDGRIDIVVEGKPGSRLWKDWLVSLVQHAPQPSGLAFEGFYDLVTNIPHPASLRLDGPE